MNKLPRIASVERCWEGKVLTAFTIVLMRWNWTMELTTCPRYGDIPWWSTPISHQGHPGALQGTWFRHVCLILFAWSRCGFVVCPFVTVYVYVSMRVYHAQAYGCGGQVTLILCKQGTTWSRKGFGEKPRLGTSLFDKRRARSAFARWFSACNSYQFRR